MEKRDLDFLAMVHLGDYGVTKQTLEQALSLYDLKKPPKPRGRPDRDLVQILIFYTYYQATEIEGLFERDVTNKKLAAKLNAARITILRVLQEAGAREEDINQFRNEIFESSVKVWRRNFRDIRETDPQRFHQIQKIIVQERQKIAP